MSHKRCGCPLGMTISSIGDAMGKASQFRIVLVTCGSAAEARKIGRGLVEKQLAACVNVLGAPVESVYRWNGKVETAPRERLLIIKTSAKRLKRVEEMVRGLHSYETPEFLVVRVAGGSKEYLDWLEDSLGGE
jgi:periplasmic divalent cation tolerance protein